MENCLIKKIIYLHTKKQGNNEDEEAIEENTKKEKRVVLEKLKGAVQKYQGKLEVNQSNLN